MEDIKADSKEINYGLYDHDGKLIAAIQMGKMGRGKTSEKKATASRKNGFAPCKEGKKRGRPFGSRNKKLIEQYGKSLPKI